MTADQVILIMKMDNVSYADLVKDAVLKDRFIACIKGSVAEFANSDGKAPLTANAVDFQACLARVAPVDTLPGCLKPDSQQMAPGPTDGKGPLCHADLHDLVLVTDLAHFGIAHLYCLVVPCQRHCYWFSWHVTRWHS